MSFPMDLQTFAFRWAATQTATTMLFLFMFGLLFNFQGFRFGRMLCGMIAAGGGFVIGTVAGPAAGAPQFGSVEIGVGLAIVLFIISVFGRRAALFMSSTFTCAALLFYLSRQVGIKGDTQWIMMAAGAATGVFLPMIMKRWCLIVLTVMQGGAMMLVGFVGLTHAVAPSLSGTLREWAATYGLLMPMFLVMMCVMGFSYQANAKQGEMTSGGSFADTVAD